MFKLFSQKKLASTLIRSYHVPSLTALKHAAVDEICDLYRKDAFIRAIDNKLICKSELENYPVDKLLIISPLFSHQKYYKNGLSFIERHELFTFSELMACNPEVIKRYITILYTLSPETISKRAMKLDNLSPKVIDRALGLDNLSPEDITCTIMKVDNLSLGDIASAAMKLEQFKKLSTAQQEKLASSFEELPSQYFSPCC